ncbi:diguanylate cyclase [Rhodoferax sp. GW822-FHT02A01]|uniref:diguanylate cyclase domain-containing protein n=1 Tax=Rhodoferax sp. GW822-FHT02A01 TaxID=3141537 RepID=UPI00315D72C3
MPNRTLLLARLKESSIDCDRRGSWGSLLYIDLDHFKTLNSTLGYDMGDLLLKQVAFGASHLGRQRQFLAASGCHACQGYLFGRLLPIDAFEAYVLNT